MQSEKGSSTSIDRESTYTGISNKYSSTKSIDRISECLSDKKIEKVKKWINDKEKEERKNNIVIKGLELTGKLTNEEIEKFVRKELKVTRCRRSGRYMTKLENEEMKRVIIGNKNRLKGKEIYIENDLSWEERKIQEEMNTWAKEKRKMGMVKIGVGRVMIDSRWER